MKAPAQWSAGTSVKTAPVAGGGVQPGPWLAARRRTAISARVSDVSGQ